MAQGVKSSVMGGKRSLTTDDKSNLWIPLDFGQEVNDNGRVLSVVTWGTEGTDKQVPQI